MKKEEEPVEWDDLPEWAKLLFCCVIGIIGVAVGALMIVGPIVLAMTLKAIWPLLLWSIPVGVGVGIAMYLDE